MSPQLRFLVRHESTHDLIRIDSLLVRDTVTVGSSTVVNQDVVAQEVIGSSVANRASDG